MDENTRAIVASNLTAAYFAQVGPHIPPREPKGPKDHPKRGEAQEEIVRDEVMRLYRAFLKALPKPPQE